MKLKEVFAHEFDFFMAMPAVAWQILFFYIPVALVILLSCVKTVQTQGTPIFTFEHYAYLVAPLFFWVIARSLVLAFVTACICLVLAYPLAYVLAVKIERYKNIFLFFLILPFWTSLMVQVYSWFFVLEHNGLLNTIFMRLGLISQPLHMLNTTFSIYLVMEYCYLPFMIFPLYTALEKVDKKMFEAAADLGGTQWQTFLKITIPLSMPGIKTGFFLVFVPSFGEFVVPTLLGGGKQLFVGSLITQYFLSARNPYLGAAFTCLSGLILLLAIGLLYWYFSKRTGLRSQPKGNR
jgi:spermidine/putrescine transport system permease protein